MAFRHLLRHGTAVFVFAIFLVWFAALAMAQGGYVPDETTITSAAKSPVWMDRYADAAANVADFRVESVAEFVKINAYYDNFVNDGTVTHAFKTASGAQIQCIDVRSQSSVRAAGLDPATMPMAPSIVEPAADSSIAYPNFGLDGSRDENGNIRQCEPGTFPKLIPNIETLYRNRTLADHFRKYPAKNAAPPLPGFKATEPEKEMTHEYGIVYNMMDNQGLIADFNLWAPYVEQTNAFSLSQLWVSGGSGYDLQTVETGWQTYPGLYGDSYPHLFIFYTTAAYADGCYNLSCNAFVQTDNSVVIAGDWPAHSEIDGDQVEIHLGFIRDGNGGGHWWLRYGQKWVGYYPTSLFDTAGIKNNNEVIEFGGEIIDDGTPSHTSSEMGSGRFPQDGYGKAAYIGNIQTVNSSGQYVDVLNLTEYSTVPECWDAGEPSYSDPELGSHFYFGGTCGECPDCTIDGKCRSNGEVSPTNACQYCDVSQSTTQWSDNDGASCDDHAFCNGDDTCQGGSCSQHEGDPCEGDQTCNEDEDSCESPDDDDDDDDNDDDDNNGDDDDGAGYRCEEILDLTVNGCHLLFEAGDELMDPNEAYQNCTNGGDIWDCIASCMDNPNVEDCDTYSECLDAVCSVTVRAENTGGDDDDDDNGGSCG